MQLALAIPMSPYNTLQDLRRQLAQLFELLVDEAVDAVALLETQLAALNGLLRELKKDLARSPDPQKAAELYAELDQDADLLATAALHKRLALVADE